MTAFIKSVKRTTEIFNYFSMATLVFMMLLVFTNTMFRYLFNAPITGTFELTRMAMVCLTPAMAVTVLAKKNVWVDLLSSRFSRIPALILDAVALPASGAVCVIIAWQSWLRIFHSMERNVHFTAIHMYEWPFRAVFFVAMCLTVLAIFAFTAERLMLYRNGGMPRDISEVDRTVEEIGEVDA